MRHTVLPILLAACGSAPTTEIPDPIGSSAPPEEPPPEPVCDDPPVPSASAGKTCAEARDCPTPEHPCWQAFCETGNCIAKPIAAGDACGEKLACSEDGRCCEEWP